MKGDRLSLVNQQIIRYTLERQAALERAHRTGEPVPASPVITVSRQFGSGGTAVAKELAQRLGYHLFDREIIEAVSLEAGVERGILDALDEKTRSGIEQWMDGVLHQSILGADEFISALSRTLITLSRLGSAVIVGRGANFLLQQEPSFHLRVVASPAVRIRNVMEGLHLGREKAEERVRAVDQERRRFVEKYLHRDIDDATAYDLVLNMDHLTRDRCVALVCDLYREASARPSSPE
jgi:cytidylate kinase